MFHHSEPPGLKTTLPTEIDRSHLCKFAFSSSPIKKAKRNRWMRAKLFYLIQYRHTSFCCTLLYCTLQVLHFFTNGKQDPLPAKRSQLALLQYLLYCNTCSIMINCSGGLEPDPQCLRGISKILSFQQTFSKLPEGHMTRFTHPLPLWKEREEEETWKIEHSARISLSKRLFERALTGTPA